MEDLVKLVRSGPIDGIKHTGSLYRLKNKLVELIAIEDGAIPPMQHGKTPCPNNLDEIMGG